MVDHGVASEEHDSLWRRLSRCRVAGLRQHVALAGILTFSAVAHLYHLNRIGPNGLGSSYYACAAQTAQRSAWHWFYLALDPAGFVSLDKPPLAPWLQALSVRLFGLNGRALLGPQALAGVLAVYLLYRLVSRSHGKPIGLCAALFLATTPVFVVASRSSHAETLLLVLLLMAARVILRVSSGGGIRWLYAAAALMGLAFNVKMLEILLVAPALVIVYLVGSRGRRHRWLHALGALLVFAAIASAWMLAVELTPPDRRPYVGGSQHNSVFELVFGYNGLARLWGEDWRIFVGDVGPQRFYNQLVGGQASWLLPLAVVGLSAAIARLCGERTWRSRSPRALSVLMWIVWLLTDLLYFGGSTFFHRYYLSILAPAVAASAAIGLAECVCRWRQGRWNRLWLPVAIAGTAAGQIALLLPYPEWSRYLVPAVAAAVLVAACLLFSEWLSRASKPAREQVALGFALAGLLLAPLVWSGIPVLTCVSETLPIAGPQPADCKPFERREWLPEPLVSYLEDNRQGAKYVAATYDMGVALFGMLVTDEPFMAIGGYRGSDPILTTEAFIEAVRSGQVRYYLSMTDEPEYPSQQPIRDWVSVHCPPAPVQTEGLTLLGPCQVRQK